MTIVKELVWIESRVEKHKLNHWLATTPFGIYRIGNPDEKPEIFGVSFVHGRKTEQCRTLEHAKHLAQRDLELRIKSLLKE